MNGFSFKSAGNILKSNNDAARWKRYSSVVIAPLQSEEIKLQHHCYDSQYNQPTQTYKLTSTWQQEIYTWLSTESDWLGKESIDQRSRPEAKRIYWGAAEVYGSGEAKVWNCWMNFRSRQQLVSQWFSQDNKLTSRWFVWKYEFLAKLSLNLLKINSLFWENH